MEIDKKKPTDSPNKILTAIELKYWLKNGFCELTQFTHLSVIDVVDGFLGGSFFGMSERRF